MRRVVATAALIFTAGLAGAPAARAADVLFTKALGEVLAAEATCGLSYDQAAISRLIETRVSADDLEFPMLLRAMTGSAAGAQSRLDNSGRTALCTQVARVAKSYGFTS